YAHVRPLFAVDAMSRELVRGLQTTLDGCIAERLRQLEKFCDTLGPSQAHDPILAGMEKAVKQFGNHGTTPAMTPEGNAFVIRTAAMAAQKSWDYISTIQGFSGELKSLGSAWLLDIEKTLSEPLLV
ncbi:MAG TPA: protein GlmU, partial [Desulfotignum sp.]|nr:protein GlmU [Desulfotignum sp.]